MAYNTPNFESFLDEKAEGEHFLTSGHTEITGNCKSENEKEHFNNTKEFVHSIDLRLPREHGLPSDSKEHHIWNVDACSSAHQKVLLNILIVYIC